MGIAFFMQTTEMMKCDPRKGVGKSMILMGI